MASEQRPLVFDAASSHQRVGQLRLPNTLPGNCTPANDNRLGPIVEDPCRDGFDFTLLFEQTILGILPAILFLLLASWRTAFLVRRDVKTSSSWLRLAKVAAWIDLAVIQAEVLFLTTDLDATGRASASLLFAAVNLVVALVGVGLSRMEDARSVCPSTLLIVYLILTIIFDLPQVRTLWLLDDRHEKIPRLPVTATAAVLAKLFLLVLESWSKRKHFLAEYKDLSLESTASIINLGFLWWLNDLIRKGYGASGIEMDDLAKLEPGLGSASLGLKLQGAWTSRQQPERRLEFLLAVCRSVWRPMLKAAIPRALNITLRFTQPALVAAVLGLLVQPEDKNTDKRALWLVIRASFLYLGISLTNTAYKMAVVRCTVMSRAAIAAMIYGKALQVEHGSYDDSAALTLMTADAASISSSLWVVHDLWSNVTEVIIGLVLLTQQLGWVSLIPLFAVGCSTYINGGITRRIGGHQQKWMAGAQKRVGATSTVLQDMRSIKMMGLSQLMTEKLQDLRIRETDLMSQVRWDIIWMNVANNFPSAFTPPLTFGLYAIQAMARGDLSSIDTTQAFTSLTIMGMLTGPAAMLMGSITLNAARIASFERVQKFLLAPDRQDERMLLPPSGIGSSSSPSPVLGLSGVDDLEPSPAESPDSIMVSAQNMSVRPAPSAPVAIQTVSFDISRASVTMVIGPVGAGKSTFLKAVLGEAPYETGILRIADDRVAYCGQTPWLPNTTIRRAICGHVSQDNVDLVWYGKCIRASALEHDFLLMDEGDGTKIGSGDTTLSGGQKHRVALARALYSRASILLLDDVLSALDRATKKVVVEGLLGKSGLLKRMGSTVLLVTSDTEYLTYADKILAISGGKIEYDGTYDDAVKSGRIDKVLLELKSHQPTEQPKEAATKSDKKPAPRDEKADERANLMRKTGDFSLYKYYFKSVGWPPVLLFFFFVFVEGAAEAFLTLWLKWWSDAGGAHLTLYLSVYLALPFSVLLGILGFAWSFLIKIGPTSSNKLHYILLKTTMNAPQRFFSATDIGKVLNLFSQDMTLIEGSLAIGVAIFFNNLVRLFINLGLISAVSLYIVICIPVLLLAIYVLQHVYLKTSRQIRYLQLESMSPLYSHFLETLNGLTTIRAFNWQVDAETKSQWLIDTASRPLYILTACQQWLMFVLGLIVGAQTVLIVGLALALRKVTDPGLLGVSLTTVIGLDSLLTSIVLGWTEFEIALGSIARVKNYESDVKPEHKEQEKCEPPADWPAKGAIEFRNVTASHNEAAIGIRNISLTIAPGQKVGICGRTGGGKSSLVGTLLRLLEIDAGTITIDGLDLSTIPRDLLRERLVTLPQEPLVLTTSVRANIDPHNVSSDAAIIDVLARVNLWDGVLGDREGGLDHELTPTSLSRGQNQLLALARALLKIRRGAQVLLLDEPTSSMDAETDGVVQRVLREEGRACTVLAIAHRVGTILGSDLVAVMEEGRVAEVGRPEELREQGGAFSSLVGG